MTPEPCVSPIFELFRVRESRKMSLSHCIRRQRYAQLLQVALTFRTPRLSKSSSPAPTDNDANTATTAITASNSTNVNPFRRSVKGRWQTDFMVSPLQFGQATRPKVSLEAHIETARTAGIGGLHLKIQTPTPKAFPYEAAHLDSNASTRNRKCPRRANPT